MKSNVSLERVLQEKQKLLQRATNNSDLDAKNCLLESISRLLDEGSFVEMYSMLTEANKTSGLITGFGTVNNRPVYIIMQCAALDYGAVSKLQSKKFTSVINSAIETGVPVVLILDSFGVDLTSGVLAMDAYSEMYASLSKASGLCPIICIVNGQCYGGNSILSQLSDFIITIDNKSQISMFGPQVISALTGPEAKIEDIQKTINENNKTFSSVVCNSELEAYTTTKLLLSFLPDSNSDIPEYTLGSDLNKLTSVNEFSTAPEILDALADTDSYIKLYEEDNQALFSVIARVGGHSVLLLITDIAASEGMISSKSFEKASKMISIADNFNIPIISLINSKGIIAETDASRIDIIKSQSNLIYNYTTATVPKIAVIMGCAFGQVFASLASKAFNDMVYALPGAIISAVSPKAAVQLLWEDKIKESRSDISVAKDELVQEYIDTCASSIIAAENGLIDDIIDPSYLRMHLIYSLEMLSSKNSLEYSKKHGNLPK